MQRKNPSAASLPGASIDMTSLLDVIFIFLFVVIIGYAYKARMAKEEALQVIKVSQQQIEIINKENEILRKQLFDQTTMEESYKKIIDDYEGDVLGKRVKIVTIYCTYDDFDSSIRQIRIDIPGIDFKPIDFNNKNSENAFNRLKLALENYIKEVRLSDQNTSDKSTELSKKERTIIVLSINREKIQRRDKVKIDSIITELESKYDDVY